jgi:diaminohydroxyphosphoribosylaminopyrimidine deaminase/5-amino-6-(5-phosphoribosylamino)uracil reductase
MKLALRLARRGIGKTSPNPMVGAVIVKDGLIIGWGYHRRYGGPHAEIVALQDATEEVIGATLYVTLEPCRHYGKTPPCVDAVIQSKIGRVVIGTLDPNPQVNGKSVSRLTQQGIETRVGVLEEACRKLNEAHFKYMSTEVPMVTLKFAQSVDGRIATATGDSQWISSEAFRRFAHRLRATHDAVMVGIDTVLADNPRLTVRLVKGRNPARVVLDSGLRMPFDAELIETRDLAPVIIAATQRADREKVARLTDCGVEVLILPEDERGEADLKALLSALGKRTISSVLVEGGAKVITSLLRQDLADKLVVAIAPKLLGKGIEAVGELDIRKMSQAIQLTYRKVYRLGEDLVVEARLRQEER